MNNELKQSALLSIVRSFFLFFGAIGSSIIGWVLVNAPTSNLNIAAWVGGGVSCCLSIISIVVYFRVMVKI